VREIVDDLEAALEQFRETIKSDIWIPGQARNDEILEIPIGGNAEGPVFMRLLRQDFREQDHADAQRQN